MHDMPELPIDPPESSIADATLTVAFSESETHKVKSVIDQAEGAGWEPKGAGSMGSLTSSTLVMTFVQYDIPFGDADSLIDILHDELGDLDVDDMGISLAIGGLG